MKFSSDISLWWLLPLAIICILLALWMYSKKTKNWVADLSPRWRITLITLRSISLFLLITLLFGIIFQAFSYRKERPILIVGVDDSSSMLNYKDSLEVKKLVEATLQVVKDQLSDKFDIIPSKFSQLPQKLEEVQFNNEITDLSSALTITKGNYYNRNLAGILLLSDGNYNTGANPLYAAEKFTTSSIYTLGVGDTITKRDQLIKHVSHNDIAFLKNDFPIVVDVEGNKMGKISSELTIEQNGNKVAGQSIQYTDGVSDYEQVTFLLTANSPGIQRYDIKISHKDNEHNYQNNTRTIYVEVIDSRSKILLLAQAPHPDLGAIRTVLEKDQNLEVDFKLLSEWNRDLKNVDLIVWHEPGFGATRDVQQAILNNSISKLFIVGSQSNATSLYQMNIGVEIPAGNRLDDVQGSLNTGFNLFETSDELGKALSYYPPLKNKYGNYKVPKDATTLVYQRIGPVVKKEPLLFFSNARTDNGKSYKYGFIYGEGIWKWKMTEYARTESTVAFDELIGKTGQLLMVKQNTEPFRVTMPRQFSPNEAISVNATVLNAALDPITTSEVQFILKDASEKEQKLQFGVIGTTYKLDLGQLPAGVYSWKSFTSIDGKRYEKKGEFIVKPAFLEQGENKANHNLLKQLSTRTNGTFHTLNNYKAAISDIQKRDDFTSASYQEATFNELIEYFYLFLLLVLVLFAEWFIRRYLGSY